MVRGAYAIRRGDFIEMSTHHLHGVVLLTISAAATAADIRDWSYFLMQPPFLIVGLQAYLVRHEKSRLGFFWSVVGWWNLEAAEISTSLLVLFGWLSGLVASEFTPLAQVAGAAVASCALCIEDNHPERKLLFLFIGRAVLCISSAAKVWLDLHNSAAIVWMALMGWAAFETFRMYHALQVQAKTT